MQNFIVLGIIPGTNIQLNFTAWLIGCVCLLIGSILFHERHTLRGYILSHYVAYRIKQLKIARI